MGETGSKFQTWWDEKSQNMESHPNGYWEINYMTCEITLLVNEA